MNLPFFKYHPDPVSTGSIVISEAKCVACEQVRGFIYECLPYAERDLENAICPWCIADNSAHQKLGAIFVDPSGVGGYGNWEAVEEKIINEVAYRTPGFIGWQQEMWFTHCADAAEFLGLAGKKELEAFGSEAIAAIKKDIGFEGEEWEEYFNSLDKKDQPTAYVFRCLHCGTYGGYSDFT